jgi:hypothetical protein
MPENDAGWPAERLAAAWVANWGPSCTTASVLTGLRLLGLDDAVGLGEATLALAGSAYAAPALLDYVALPGRRAPLDVRIEALAARHGVRVRARTSPVAPWWRPRPRAGEVLVLNLAWGQESPGRRGSWGWHPLRPATYSTGGHSVVLGGVAGGDGRWIVVDPNHAAVQRWAGRGLPVTVTRLRRAPGA